MDGEVGNHLTEYHCGHGEIQTLEPQAGNADNYPCSGGHDTGKGQGNPERSIKSKCEDSNCVGPYGHECSMPERDLPGTSRQDIQTQRPENSDLRKINKVDYIGIRNKREDEKQGEKQAQPDLDPYSLKQLYIFPVAFLEAFAKYYQDSSSNSFDFLFSKKPVRPNHQYNKKNDKAAEIFYPASKILIQIASCEVLYHSNYQAPYNGARNTVKPP